MALTPFEGEIPKPSRKPFYPDIPARPYRKYWTHGGARYLADKNNDVYTVHYEFNRFTGRYKTVFKYCFNFFEEKDKDRGIGVAAKKKDFFDTLSHDKLIRVYRKQARKQWPRVINRAAIYFALLRMMPQYGFLQRLSPMEFTMLEKGLQLELFGPPNPGKPRHA